MIVGEVALTLVLNETAGDKILQYRTEYNNRPSNGISFMSVVPSTSTHLHCNLVRLLFLQTHRETDHFVPASGFQLIDGEPIDSRPQF
jgi:hypothetical protein